MEPSQKAQLSVDIELSKERVAALERMWAGVKEQSISSDNPGAPVRQGPADIENKGRAPKVANIIADHAGVSGRTVEHVIRVQNKLQDEPELLAEIQGMMRNMELQAKPAAEFVTYPV